MRIVVVTGMSGAGKRTALKVFEDLGYYCVDNLPVELVVSFAELAVSGRMELENIAIGIDVRTGDDLFELEPVFGTIKKMGINYEILFLDAEDDVLIKRYKETRRNHPLAGENRILDGIIKERAEVDFLKKEANYIIDTSTLLTRELRQEIEHIFIGHEQFANLVVTILSFGFKYGIPEDADLVFDVRFMPNPYYVAELKPLTGNDEAVQNYVMNSEQSHLFVDKLYDMVEFLIPNYVLEGKNRLVIALGCTGGKHRSVTVANTLFDRLKGKDFGLKIVHRDIDNDSRKK